MKKILGVSGSPIADSNTDRALKAVLEATGLETEFVKFPKRTSNCRQQPKWVSTPSLST